MQVDSYASSAQEERQLQVGLLQLRLPHLIASMLSGGDSSRWLDQNFVSGVSSVLRAAATLYSWVLDAPGEAPQVAALIEESGVLQPAAAAQEQVAVLLRQQLRDLESASRPHRQQYEQAAELLLLGHELLVFWDRCFAVSMLSGSKAVTPPALQAAHLANALFQGSVLCAPRDPVNFSSLALAAVHIFQAGMRDAGIGVAAAVPAATAAAAAGAASEQQAAAAAAAAQRPPIDARLLQLLLMLLVLDAYVAANGTGGTSTTSAAGSNSCSTAAAPSAATATATADGCVLESPHPLAQACELLWDGLSLPATTLPLFARAWKGALHILQEVDQMSSPSPDGGSSACSMNSGSVGSGGSGSGSGDAGGQAAEEVALLGAVCFSTALVQAVDACVWHIRQGDVPSGIMYVSCSLLDAVIWRLPQLLVALAAHSSSLCNAASSSSSSSDANQHPYPVNIIDTAACSLQLWAQAGVPGALQRLADVQHSPEECAGMQQKLNSWTELMLTSCTQLLQQQTLLLDAAAVAPAAVEQGGDGTCCSTSTSSSGGGSCEQGGSSPAMRALTAQLRVAHKALGMLSLLPAFHNLATDAAWCGQGAAVCRALEQVSRTLGRVYTTLGSSSSSSSSSSANSGSAQNGDGSSSVANSGGSRGATGGPEQQWAGGQRWQDAQQMCVSVFGALSRTLQHLLAVQNTGEVSALTTEACCCTTHGLEERRALASLAASYLKLCDAFGQAAPAAAQYGALAGFAIAVPAIAALLTKGLQGEYCLAAVRAATAPWMVLLGRQLMLAAAQLSPILAQASQAALAAGQGAQQGPTGGCLDCDCKTQLSHLIGWVLPVAAVGQALDLKLLSCWISPAGEQYQGQRQYPDAEQQQGCGTQAQVHPKHHPQRPGLPLALRASSSGGGSRGGSREGSGSAAAGCVLLDDLDSWCDGPLTDMVHKLAPTHNILCEMLELIPGSEAAVARGANDCEPAEASSSNSSGSGGSSGHQAGGSSSAAASGAGGKGASHDETPAQALARVLQSGHLEGLPQLLHAAGSSLCSQLAVPWFCNNPNCRSLSGASELRLVGGRGCVCGGCTVARYCGRACQRAHWKQHKPVCRALAARAAAQAGPASS